MLGVPYSPIVPSLIKCASGHNFFIANSKFKFPITLLYCVKTAFSLEAIE